MLTTRKRSDLRLPQVGFNTRNLCTIELLGALKLVSEQFSDVDNLHYGHRGPAAPNFTDIERNMRKDSPKLQSPHGLSKC